MGFHSRYDGEFWMEFFTDFVAQFEEVSICTLGPDFDHNGSVDEAKSVKVTFGEWVPGLSAGGCRNNLALFATNPQFLLTILDGDLANGNAVTNGDSVEADSEDDGEEDRNHNVRKSQVIISLAQEHRRSQRDRKVKLLQIGFCLYRAGERMERLTEQHFMYNYDEGTSGPYINYREVFARFELPQGSYVIIPATFEPEASSRFMIRVYSGSRFSLKNLKM